jgi:N-acetylmuramoyl-L-alanine amidase
MNPSEILQSIAIFVLGSLCIVCLLVFRAPLTDKLADSLEGSALPITITPQMLHTNYKQSKIKILLVPGHDLYDTGAQYKNTREADLTLEVAKNLYSYLAANKKYNAQVTRDFQTGDYTNIFSTYFSTQAEAIKTFRDQAKYNIAVLSSKDLFTKSEAPNRPATQPTSVRLYGINKWANEHNIDIVLHIHFNDSSHTSGHTRKYSGFVIYAPEHELGNSEASKKIAYALYEQLKTMVPQSDFESSYKGTVENQELIAVGANATLKSVGLLTEYGFVYEPQFQNSTTRALMTRELAYQTYQGLENYFSNMPPARTTTLLPFHWNRPLAENTDPNADVLAIQAALHKDSLYPPPGKTLSDCPLSGVFGPCTKEAVKLFQDKYGIMPTENGIAEKPTGVVGALTLEKLNKLYGALMIQASTQ